MSECIVVFRMPNKSLRAMSDCEGNPIVFDSDSDAEVAVRDHPFIWHREYELLELNV